MSNTQTMTNHQLYLRLMDYVAPYRLVFSLVLLGVILMAIIDSILPVLIKPMLDSIFVSKNQDSMQLIPLIFMAFFVVRSLVSYISSYGRNWISNTLTVDLQTAMFDKLLILPTHYYVGQTSDRFNSILTSEVTQVTQDGARAVITSIKNTLTIIGLLVWMLYLSWELSLLALMITSIVVLSMQVICGQSQDADWETHQAIESFTQVIRESIENYKVVALNGGRRYEANRFQDEADQIRRFNMKHVRANIFKIPLVQIVIGIALSAILYLAIQQTFTDEMTIGGFVSFIVSMLILSLSLKQLVNANKFLQRSLTAAKNIFSIINLEAETDIGTIVIDRAQGELQFEQVAFYYDFKENTVLKDFSLTIKPREIIALVGSSDDTKNALVNLIPRFFQPTHGKILLDGHDLTTIKLDSLRSNIGLVSQEITLFNDSIAANIAYGEMGRSTEGEIIAAARAAHAIEFIREMPQGMQTQVGKHGVKLSRGQCQRIAIARAFLKNPPILILDEAVPILDSESEHYTQEALDNLMQNRTTIIIARRRTTVEKADRVIVLEQDHITEIGNHQELLSKKGVYSELYLFHH